MNKKTKSLIITAIITIAAICLSAAFVSRKEFCGECHAQIKGKAYLVEESYGDHEREFVCEQCLRTISFWYDDDDYSVIKTVNLNAGKTILIILELLIGGGIGVLFILGKEQQAAQKISDAISNGKSFVNKKARRDSGKCNTEVICRPKTEPHSIHASLPQIAARKSVPETGIADELPADPKPASGLRSTMRKAEAEPTGESPRQETPNGGAARKYFAVRNEI